MRYLILCILVSGAVSANPSIPNQCYDIDLVESKECLDYKGHTLVPFECFDEDTGLFDSTIGSDTLDCGNLPQVSQP